MAGKWQTKHETNERIDEFLLCHCHGKYYEIERKMNIKFFFSSLFLGGDSVVERCCTVGMGYVTFEPFISILFCHCLRTKRSILTSKRGNDAVVRFAKNYSFSLSHKNDDAEYSLFRFFFFSFRCMI